MKKNYLKTLTIFLLLFSATVSAQDYMSLLKEEITKKRSNLGLEQSDVQSLEMISQTVTRSTGVTHIYAVQKYNDIVIFNAVVNGAFRNGELLTMSNRLESNLASRVNALSPSLNPMQAATSAARKLGLGSSSFSVIETISTKEYILTNGNVSLEEVPVQLVYVLDGDVMKLAWDLDIHTLDAKHWWSVRVDALTGEIIDQIDWVVSCSFETHNHNKSSNKVTKEKSDFSLFDKNEANAILAGEQYFVYALPLESPNHGNPSLVTDPQDLNASPFGWHDTDGVEGAEFTITRGNNVYAQEDLNADNIFGEAPDGGTDLIFNFPYDLDSNPINYLDAATTNLFYWNNISHDIFFQYGFDEESGNFQETNYTGLGLGSDSVTADAQDGGDFNNANFFTPADGRNPRMQMFLFSGPSGEDLTITGGPLAGGYIGVPAGFGAPLPEDTPITSDIVVVLDDNAGTSTDDTDACDTITNAADIQGNIAVLRRGTCEFGTKVLAAETAGAIAVIVVNNAPGAPTVMAPGAVGDQVTIPSLMISQTDGDAIIAALQNGDTVNASILSATINLDSDLDNGIIVHEYAHGVSSRLTGGRFNPNCMRTCLQFEQDANGNTVCVAGTATEVMSEGWSDYFALMLTMEEGDSGEDARGIGTFASNQPTDGVGIRPTPYSTDVAINPSTYDSVAVFENTTAPHPVGYVWTTMIWDMTWGLIEEFGFDSDFYNGTGGNNIALQLVIDGLKLQPCNPGFVDGRDAILAALDINPFLTNEDMRRAAGCRVWTAFANRGLGFSADQGQWQQREDGTAAIDFPEGNDNFCNALSISENSVGTNFNVFPNPSNGTMIVQLATSLGNGTVKVFDLNGRVVYTKDALLEGSVNVEAQGLSTGVYLLQIQSDQITETVKLIIE